MSHSAEPPATDWPAFWAGVRAETITDVTGRPEDVPPGELFTLHHSDGTVGLTLPRRDLIDYINQPNTPHVYIRLVPPDNPF